MDNYKELLWLNGSYFLIFLIEIPICGWKSSSLYMLLFPKPENRRSAFWDAFVIITEMIGVSTFMLGVLLIWEKPLYNEILKKIGLDLWPGPQTLLLGIGFYILYDFLNYWFHRAEHKFSILWNGHQFHHSATFVNTITNDRDHPIRRVLHFKRWLFLIFGVYTFNIYVMQMRHLMNRLAHSRIDTDYGWVGRYIIVSPRYHHLHHEINHNFYNYAEMFVFWDRIFGTYQEPKYSIRTMKCGVENNFFEKQNPVKAYLKPFIDFYWIPANKIASFVRIREPVKATIDGTDSIKKA